MKVQPLEFEKPIVELEEKLADLKWQGAYKRFMTFCHDLGDEKIPMRIPRWREESK